MDPRDMIASLRHAWYVLVAGLLAAGGLTYVIVTQVGPTYEAEASIVLVPGDGVIPENSNPFLYLSGGTALRDVMVRMLSSDEFSESLLDGRSADTEYVVGPDPTTAGPILLTTTSAATEEEALATLQDFLGDVPTWLADVQERREVPAQARFTSMVLAQDQEATANRSTMIRLLVAAVGACGVLVLFIAAWLEGRRRKSARHAAKEAEPPTDEAEPPTDETAPADLGDRDVHAAAQMDPHADRFDAEASSEQSESRV